MNDPSTLWIENGHVLTPNERADFNDATPYVPAARLDAANLENARLKGVMRRVAASMGHSGGETPEYLPCNESCVDCDEDTIAETHRPDLPADCCSDHPDADGELDCWRCLLTAALAPSAHNAARLAKKGGE